MGHQDAMSDAAMSDADAIEDADVMNDDAKEDERQDEKQDEKEDSEVEEENLIKESNSIFYNFESSTSKSFKFLSQMLYICTDMSNIVHNNDEEGIKFVSFKEPA